MISCYTDYLVNWNVDDSGGIDDDLVAIVVWFCRLDWVIIWEGDYLLCLVSKIGYCNCYCCFGDDDDDNV